MSCYWWKGNAVVIAEQIYSTSLVNKDVEFLGFAFDDETFGTEINGFPILAKPMRFMKNTRMILRWNLFSLFIDLI